jgi:uncharacterized protein YlxW (UPF0749 family)
MPSAKPSLGRRLLRLPGQFLVAMINATAILVIAACVLAIIVLDRVNGAAEAVAASVTDATLARLQVSPTEFKARLAVLDDRIAQIATKLDQSGANSDGELVRQVAQLNATLADLKLAADGIKAAGPEVTDAAFRQAGTILTESLLALRGCAPATSTPGPES